MNPFLAQATGINPINDVPIISADSLKNETLRMIETLRTSSPSEVIHDVTNDLITFGLKVLAALLIYLIGGWIIRRIMKLLRSRFERKKTDHTVVTFTTSLVSITLWTIVIILTISTLGVNTSSIAALLAAGGVALGMALSGTVQNFAGGLMILIFKPFKAGDFIEAQGFSGKVLEVNIVNTKLRTYDNKELILPNGALFNGNIINESVRNLRRVDKVFSVSYGSDLNDIRKVILDITNADPRILNSSTPGADDVFIGINELASNGVEIKVRVWVQWKDFWGVYYDLNEAIYKKLPENGIHFPFPQLDVHLKS